MVEDGTQLQLIGITGESCASAIEQAVMAVSGVNGAFVNLSESMVLVRGKASASDLTTAIEKLGYSVTIIGLQSLQFSIPSMNCASCVNKIERAVDCLQGITSATVSIADKQLLVNGNASSETIMNALNSIGYPGKLIQHQENHDIHHEQVENERYRYLCKQATMALGIGIPLMLWGLVTGNMGVNNPMQKLLWGAVGFLTLLVLVVSGNHYFKGMWRSLAHGSASMDTLVAMGTSIAWLYSMIVVIFPEWLPMSARHVYFEAAAMIIGLVNLGHALELKARGKASEAVKRLLGLQVKTVRVVKGNQEDNIAIDLVAVGNIIRVRPGEKIAVDGSVVEGSSLIDESMLTGEPFPVGKNIGDQLYAGTLNKNGSLLFRAEQVGEQTTLAQIVTLVKKSQNTKMPIARLADKIAAVFVPCVIVIAIVAAVFWYLFGPDPKIANMLVVVTTVLIIACPCALGLATPLSVIVGVGKAAEMGMLIRQGDALQQASKITTVVVDKTGTVTQGKPQVTHILSSGMLTENQLLAFAASIEKSSEHPLADAICRSAKQRDLSLHGVTDFHAVSGQGAVGFAGQNKIILGNEKLMLLQSIAIDALESKAEIFAKQGQTPIYISVNNKLEGLIIVADQLRNDSKDAIHRLRQLGVKVVMLTGDTVLTSEAVAKQVNIDTVIASVLPTQKAEYVQRLQQQGEIVGMTGDGINDAPALAQANVSFAIGSGTDIAIETADITLLRSSLHGLTDAIELSRATLRNIKQNLLGAFIYNALGIPIAAGILFPFTGMLLNPIIAGAAMALSSVTVVSNANRLKWFKPSTFRGDV